MGIKETNNAKRIMLAVAKHGVRLFVNPRGFGWTGKKKETPVTFGVGPNGAGDLLGWTPVKITPEMVGSTVAVFTSYEIKTENGTVQENQERWREGVKRAGGIAVICRTPEDGEMIARQGLFIF